MEELIASKAFSSLVELLRTFPPCFNSMLSDVDVGLPNCLKELSFFNLILRLNPLQLTRPVLFKHTLIPELLRPTRA